MKKSVISLGFFLFVAVMGFAQTYYVIQDGNLREGPDAKNEVVIVLTAGTEVELISSEQNNGFYSIRVKSTGTEGYLHNSLVSSTAVKKSTPSKPSASASSSSSSSSGRVWVDGYYRKNGTYVKGHWRKK
jgi:uncharacterized protein YgiM (DUF1202 family)